MNGWLYAVQMVIPDYLNPIKIGFATNVQNRMAAYSCGPFPVQQLGSWRGTLQDERAVHKQFANHRLTGEWFYPAEELLLLVQVKTGIVDTGKRRPPNEEARIKRLLRPFADDPHEAAISGLVRKASEVLARYRTAYLSSQQVAILLDLPTQAVRDLVAENLINYQQDTKHTITDLVDLLRESPAARARAGTERWKSCDEFLYPKTRGVSALNAPEFG